MTKNEARKIPLRYRKYLVLSKEGYIFTQAPEKYVNHSCNPNTKEKNHCDVAFREIKKGEEITTDYTTDNPHLKMKCKCENNNRKKII